MKHTKSRDKIVVDECRNKDVLDIGSTGQTEAYELWPRIKKAANSVTGIDIVEHKDNNIVLGNMETYKFKRKFDIAVAGDVIEHVHNQGLFLNNIRDHLKVNGKLIITTPNAKWFTVILKPNPTHVIWHDPYTLSYMLGECGFEVEYSAFYFGNKKYSWYKKPFVWRQGMIFVCKKSKNFVKTKPEKILLPS